MKCVQLGYTPDVLEPAAACVAVGAAIPRNPVECAADIRRTCGTRLQIIADKAEGVARDANRESRDDGTGCPLETNARVGVARNRGLPHHHTRAGPQENAVWRVVRDHQAIPQVDVGVQVRDDPVPAPVPAIA